MRFKWVWILPWKTSALLLDDDDLMDGGKEVNYARSLFNAGNANEEALKYASYKNIALIRRASYP